jgi:hypothetical protein
MDVVNRGAAYLPSLRVATAFGRVAQLQFKRACERPPAAFGGSPPSVDGFPSWRQDGKEMYFMNLDREVLAVDVTLNSEVSGRNSKGSVQSVGSAGRSTCD